MKKMKNRIIKIEHLNKTNENNLNYQIYLINMNNQYWNEMDILL